ncbi:MAG TPA: hypothetical protein VLA82_02365 [Actinomycetota bacterium]|nr:hypothetical protein [Actinomycetota bacterium]
MKRLALAIVVGVVTLIPQVAVAAPPEGAGENVPEVALAKCEDVVGRQSDKELDTGGGPKDGLGAPTNCDWFFFFVGAIGGSD